MSGGSGDCDTDSGSERRLSLVMLLSAAIILFRLLAQAPDEPVTAQHAFSPRSKVEFVVASHSRGEAFRVLEGMGQKRAGVPGRYDPDTKLGALLRNMLQLEPTLRPTTLEALLGVADVAGLPPTNASGRCRRATGFSSTAR
jgi:hypothetical protein